MPAKYGYWPIQGRGTPSRMALAYAGEQYEDVVYNFAATEGAADHWATHKFNLGLDFPNLPYYIDGDFKLTQSNAILKHVARKHGFYGKSIEDQAKIDMLIDTSDDCKNAMIKIVFNPDFVR